MGGRGRCEELGGGGGWRREEVEGVEVEGVRGGKRRECNF